MAAKGRSLLRGLRLKPRQRVTWTSSGTRLGCPPGAEPPRQLMMRLTNGQGLHLSVLEWEGELTLRVQCGACGEPLEKSGSKASSLAVCRNCGWHRNGEALTSPLRLGGENSTPAPLEMVTAWLEACGLDPLEAVVEGALLLDGLSGPLEDLPEW